MGAWEAWGTTWGHEGPRQADGLRLPNIPPGWSCAFQNPPTWAEETGLRHSLRPLVLPNPQLPSWIGPAGRPAPHPRPPSPAPPGSRPAGRGRGRIWAGPARPVGPLPRHALGWPAMPWDGLRRALHASDGGWVDCPAYFPACSVLPADGHPPMHPGTGFGHS